MLKRRSTIYGADLIVIREHGGFDTTEGQRRLYRILTLSMGAGDGEIKVRHLPLNPVRRWRKSLDALAQANVQRASAGSDTETLLKRQQELQAAERNLDGFIAEVVAKYSITDKFEAWQSLTDEERATVFEAISPT